jgi:hypothetical protein
MALWGNNDNISAAGRVTLDYATGIVTGFTGATNGTLFGQAGSIQEGDVIRFGVSTKPGVYFGDAVVVSIASTIQLTIGSTAGLSGVAIANYFIPSITTSKIYDWWILPSAVLRQLVMLLHVKYMELLLKGLEHLLVLQYEEGVGWVGVQTYMGTEGTLRVKKGRF